MDEITDAVAEKLFDWVQVAANIEDDPEARPAGFAEPHYTVSDKVSLSRDHGLYVYHLADDQLGQGSSLGNAYAWVETKGNGDMLNFFDIGLGVRVMGGMALTYLIPFSNVSTLGKEDSDSNGHHSLNRILPSSVGTIHLHPAYQQREFSLGDGLNVIETLYVRRTDEEDLPAVYESVFLENRTSHPIAFTVVVSLVFRGNTPQDLQAEFDSSRQVLLAWNKSKPDWVRFFGVSEGSLRGYWATTLEDEAYSPSTPLPNKTDQEGDLIGALQFDISLYPGHKHKIRVVSGFSSKGESEALKIFDQAINHRNALKDTRNCYSDIIGTAVLEMPDDLLTHGIQWAKACILRPISKYKVGVATTNDPGNSSHIVGRDTAWYVHGCDYIHPSWSCSMLAILAEHQRADGLIPEYIDGITGETEDLGFNINDDTPLFIMAVNHHLRSTGHKKCLDALYEPARKAGELILKQRNKFGLVECTATGLGAEAICGWRNVLQNQSISGVVTEVNSECFAAFRALGDLAEMKGDHDQSEAYRKEADNLRTLINKHLINPRNGLYVLNISPDGSVHTQVSSDQVFPLICGVADQDTADAVTSRLAEADFMTEAGIRVLPSEDPHYDPSFESGCMGGVWQGVTWWYALSAAGSNANNMAESLRRAYAHYVSDPKAYNTVPGQFSEWSDGQTLVNRGMRLSPWDAPRFLWAAVEGVAGIKLDVDGIDLQPMIPNDWLWLYVRNVAYRDGQLSYFLTRESDGFHIYTADKYNTKHKVHTFDEEIEQTPESITIGVSVAAFRSGNEVIMCFGSSLSEPALGPFLTHHSLSLKKRYRIYCLASHNLSWKDMGVKRGVDLQRIVVKIEKRGYAIYRFVAQ